MKIRPYIVFLLVIMLAGLTSMLQKKRSFLDHFTNYKYDTLKVANNTFDEVYNTSSPLEVTGTLIDTSFKSVYELEGGEDLRMINKSETEKGLLAYQKIKLDAGYYLLIIRGGGEFWNSRKLACLYNSGDKHIMDTYLLADDVHENNEFICTSLLKREDNVWSIYTRELYYEPVDAKKYGKDSMYVKQIDILTNIEPKEEHFIFVEKGRKESRMK